MNIEPSSTGEISEPQEIGRTVLVVDDDSGVRRFASRLLKKQGLTVLEAEDGQQAIGIAMAHNGLIDLLLTDISMPSLNGRELEQKLAPVFPQMTTVFMSGYAIEAHAEQDETGPVIHMLNKPFSVQTFISKIQLVLGI